MPITVLSQPPPALTRAELDDISATTPDSFEGIAPLLRLKQDSVRVTCDAAFEGFEGGEGELWITEGAVSFYSPSTSTGLSIPYPHLTLHAISRAPAPAATNGDSAGSASAVTAGGPCIYCQVDEIVPDAESDDMQGETHEVIIVPTDSEAVDNIFSLLSACAALHPSPTSPGGQGSGGGGLFGGLDPDSMVYADANGNVVGPGLEDDATEDAQEGDEPAQDGGEAGRVRSDFVADTRHRPY